MSTDFEKNKQDKQEIEDPAPNVTNKKQPAAQTTVVKSESLEESEQDLDNAFATVQSELNLVQNKYARLGAEFENFKRRSDKKRQNTLKYANEQILIEILPIIDHLEQAIASGQNETKGDKSKGVLLGVQMVLKQFEDVMKKFGIEGFSALGKPFDPNLHEAMTQQVDDTVEGGTVLQEYQKGYTLNSRLVRAARVVVSKKD